MTKTKAPKTARPRVVRSLHLQVDLDKKLVKAASKVDEPISEFIRIAVGQRADVVLSPAA